jgi:glutamate-1-semialdehyde 2,1-aminomutase
VQQHADRMAALLRAGFNDVLARRDVPGFVWGESSVFHTMLGTSCANRTSGDLHTPEGVSPQALKAGSPPELGHTLHLSMLNQGIDLFHGGGLLSSAHSNSDIDRTVAAFDASIATMKEGGLFA